MSNFGLHSFPQKISEIRCPSSQFQYLKFNKIKLGKRLTVVGSGKLKVEI